MNNERQRRDWCPWHYNAVPVMLRPTAAKYSENAASAARCIATPALPKEANVPKIAADTWGNGKVLFYGNGRFIKQRRASFR